jgi:hypothetical protein
MSLTTTKFMQYSVLPGIWPRIKGLLGSGLSFLAGTLAVVYYNLGLLPANHLYLNKENYGRFGVRHVVAAAGKHLVFSWKNIDKIVLYFTILVGLTILALQLVIIVTSLIFYAPAFAAGTFLNSFSATLGGAFAGGVREIVDVFFSGAGIAGASGWIVFSETAAGPSQDIAFVVLDQVFGIMQQSGTAFPIGFYESCVSTPVVCTNIQGEALPPMGAFPSPLHLAMHQMFGFYTMGIAFISLIVILYYIVTIVGETVTTGTPFGQRFNKAWFIPRLIVFFALLAPITLVGNNRGINVAQLITFSVAKFGSNFATNAWLVFIEGGINQAANSNTVFFGKGQDMLAIPKVPELGSLVQYLYIVRMCMFAEKLVHGKEIIPYVVRPHSEDTTNTTRLDGTIVPYNAIGGDGAAYTEDYLPYYQLGTSAPIDFHQAVEFSRYRDVVLRFGHRNPPGGIVNDPNDPPDSYSEEWGYVEPTCGELQFEITSLDPFVVGPGVLGADAVQDTYWDYVDSFLFWDDISGQTTYCMLQSILPYAHDPTCIDAPITGGSPSPGQIGFDVNGMAYSTQLPIGAANTSRWLTLPVARTSIENINAMLRMFLSDQVSTWNSITVNAGGMSLRDSIELVQDDETLYISSLVFSDRAKERGWAGAALWYNQLAQLNGLYSSAIQNIPRPFKYPLIMEDIAEQHQAQDENSIYTTRFNPRLANGQLAELQHPGDQYIAAALYNVFEFWNNAAVQETVFTRKSNNPIIDTINMILGTNGIYDIVENRGTYPLAMLSGLGKSMVDAALRNLWVGVVGQGIGELMDGFLGGLASVGSSFAFRFGMIGLGIGFILYYVLPVLPFVYFFFAFSGWIKSIFEAVLAMPLWALAHINIEGNGLPGPWASNGYFLLFEIFLRPILIVGGFIFSISLFAALVNALHDSYHVVVMVTSGFDMIGEMNNLNVGAIANLTASDPIAYMRGPVDEMFYSVVYVIMVYMLGLSCFKLVDTIPNNILRWMGVTVSAFQEKSGDPAGEMTGKLFRATQVTNIQLTGLINKAQGFSNAGNDAQMAMLYHT